MNIGNVICFPKKTTANLRTFSVVALVFLHISCSWPTHSDITNSEQAIRLGVLGRQFHTSQELILKKDDEMGVLMMVTNDYNYGNIDHRIGIIAAGTHVKVCRVMNVTGGSLLVSTWTGVFATIEDGPFIGKEIVVRGGPVGRGGPIGTSDPYEGANIEGRLLVEDK
jgi:hypothetical protein